MNQLKTLLILCALVSGCASEDDYQKAFSDQTALTGNARSYRAPTNITLRMVRQVLVRQGFTIEHVDNTTGVIKAVRNMQDRSDKDLSYNITASADVSESSTAGSVVTLAASQQTVLHRQDYIWWHLLWLLPIFPIGTEYQTVVTNEGNVTDEKFYKDFFVAVGQGLLKAPSTLNLQQGNP